MKNLDRVLEPPQYFSWHRDIVNSKRNGPVKTALQGLSNQVALRYQELENYIGSQTIESINVDDVMQANSEELLSCYKNKTKKTNAVFKVIKSAQTNEARLSRCPYCGITTPNTHDHYLPEDRFPEFAVHPLNLVPCCSGCNSSKGNRWIIDNRRLFLHFYSDELSSEQYLFVQIVQRNGNIGVGAKFYISENKPTDVTDFQWQLIKSHYTRLSLIERYNEEVNSEVASIFTICKSHLSDGGQNIENFLNIQATSEESIYGINYWRVVLMRKLAQTPDFRDIVQAAVT